MRGTLWAHRARSQPVRPRRPRELSALSRSLALCFTESVLRAGLQGRAGPAWRSEQRLPGALNRPASRLQSLTRTHAAAWSRISHPHTLVRDALSGHVRLPSLRCRHVGLAEDPSPVSRARPSPCSAQGADP